MAIATAIISSIVARYISPAIHDESLAFANISVARFADKNAV
jgi:hypothetical protein